MADLLTLLTALGAGLLAYVSSVRWGVWRWLAATATLPFLLAVRSVGPSWIDASSLCLLALGSVGLAVLCWWARASVPRLVGGLAALALAVVSWHAFGAGGSGTGDVDPSRAVVFALATALALALAAAGGLGRARPAALRSVCGLLLAVPTLVLLTTTGAAWPSTPDALVALLWWPAAGALGLTALARGRRSSRSARPQSDAVDDRVAAAFDATYGTPRLGQVVVVIAAYNERGGIADVLESLPRTVCDLATDVLVVDDGSIDGTATAVTAAPRGYLAACPVNRGQGAALRLGYRIAREHGADYILTTDADGQYDAADFPAVLGPVLAGDADFVTGSRLLGRQHTHDRFRRLGVHVFAWTVTVLTGQRLTDTSFGLRAMRAEATERVTLNQPQYQSSELLLGMLSHGFAVREVPGTMHVRAAGSTKKGGNLVYGTRYARVVLGTWWREGCPAPVTERAPAFRESRARRAG